MDETSDITTKEEVSICFRFVDDNLQIKEMFMGFYKTATTVSAALFDIVQDVLMRFTLDIKNCCGQCYDGAANVSGHIAGLQRRILELESRAVFVHCSAHNLNFVVQDAMQINAVRDFLAILRELISFVRNSPKRLAIFKSFQEDTNDDELNLLSRNRQYTLRPFCPTRWCVRIKSLNH